MEVAMANPPQKWFLNQHENVNPKIDLNFH